MRGTALQRYEALVAVRQAIQLPKALPAHTTMGEAATETTAGPYALAQPEITAHSLWRAALARGWVWGHVGLALGAAITGVTLTLAAPTERALGLVVLGFATAAIVLSALALQAAQTTHLRIATTWLLLCDLLAAGTGTLLLGSQVGLYALFPGVLLLAALLADRFVTVIGIGGAFIVYATGVALTQTGALHPLLNPSGAAFVWINLGLVFAGTALFALAAQLLLTQLHLALTNEAALSYRVVALERRARTKRIAFDADAMALQTQIARAMHDQRPQTVATCEELAPLAQMINAANTRIPSLLHDRDERLKLERAVRDLIQALEAAWAGFTLTWPAPSHTVVDRLIPLLRPNPTQATTTLKTTR